MLRHFTSIMLFVLASVLFSCNLVFSGQDSHNVRIAEAEDVLRVEINGELFTEYHFQNVARPFFYPVIGLTGKNLTRHWPMKEGKDEQHDHRHHRSLWFTHGAVNGHDFWSEGRGNKVVHERFVEISSGKDKGVIHSESKWVAKDGTIVCTDSRKHTFYNRPGCKMLDFEVTIHASHGEVVMGDTKEGTMAIRVAPTLRLKGSVAQGHIVTSEGIRGNKAWGTKAVWCDYYGPLDGEVVGIAIFNHPGNPRHPTWWMARNYGLFAANPFGAHYFERKPKGTGDITIPAGKSMEFRYRFYFHKGNEKEAEVDKHYREYIARCC